MIVCRMFVALVAWFALHGAATAETPRDAKPLCVIAAISNPYITTSTAEELGKRSFLEKTTPIGLRRALAAAEALSPDALVILGSLTWSGSDADFERFESFVADVKVPLYLTPGPQDLSNGGWERFARRFPKRGMARKSLRLNGVHVQFATRNGTDAAADKELVDWMAEDMQKTRDARGVLVFEGLDYRAPADGAADNSPLSRYWRSLKQGKVAVRMPASHSHSVSYLEQAPIWSIPSSGWTASPAWDIALISVYPQTVTLQLFREGKPPQTLEVPNPVAAEPLPKADDDPYGVPTYSEDLAKKPRFSFVQLSDSQFDDGSIPGYERYAYDEQMNAVAVKQVNRLKPALVFMTGDLTNKSTAAEWNTFHRFYSQLKPPFYALPGNHDLLTDRSKVSREALGKSYETSLANWKLADKVSKAPTTDRMALYRHFVRPKPYFRVEHRDCVFLCLNTWVAEVDREQVQWLAKELENTKSAKHVFVLGHYPLLKEFGGNIAEPAASEILELLRRHQVVAYLSGHRHRYNYLMRDGTAHVLCDCLCWGEYCSYQIYHVFDDRIVACWKPIFRADGNRPLYERVVLPEPRYAGKK